MRLLLALTLLVPALAFLPSASACTNILPPNGVAGVYDCGGGRLEVRSGGTLAATGPTSGIGWYVVGPNGEPYVAADFSCFGGWCYVTAAALPVQAIQPRFNSGTLDVVVCVSGTLTGCVGT